MFECLTLVFDSGISLFDPFGNEQMVHPRLYAYVCDHPEGCKVIKFLQIVLQNKPIIYFILFYIISSFIIILLIFVNMYVY